MLIVTSGWIYYNGKKLEEKARRHDNCIQNASVHDGMDNSHI